MTDEKPADEAEVESHIIWENVNETTVEDDEVEGHGSLPNTNESVVEDDAESRATGSTTT